MDIIRKTILLIAVIGVNLPTYTTEREVVDRMTCSSSSKSLDRLNTVFPGLSLDEIASQVQIFIGLLGPGGVDTLHLPTPIPSSNTFPGDVIIAISQIDPTPNIKLGPAINNVYTILQMPVGPLDLFTVVTGINTLLGAGGPSADTMNKVTYILNQTGGGDLTTGINTLLANLGGAGSTNIRITALLTNLGGLGVTVNDKLTGINTLLGAGSPIPPNADTTSKVTYILTQIGGLDLTTGVNTLLANLGGAGSANIRITALRTNLGGLGVTVNDKLTGINNLLGAGSPIPPNADTTSKVTYILTQIGGLDLTTGANTLLTKLGGTSQSANDKVRDINTLLGVGSLVSPNADTTSKVTYILNQIGGPDLTIGTNTLLTDLGGTSPTANGKVMNINTLLGAGSLVSPNADTTSKVTYILTQIGGLDLTNGINTLLTNLGGPSPTANGKITDIAAILGGPNAPLNNMATAIHGLIAVNSLPKTIPPFPANYPNYPFAPLNIFSDLGLAISQLNPTVSITFGGAVMAEINLIGVVNLPATFPFPNPYPYVSSGIIDMDLKKVIAQADPTGGINLGQAITNSVTKIGISSTHTPTPVIPNPTPPPPFIFGPVPTNRNSSGIIMNDLNTFNLMLNAGPSASVGATYQALMDRFAIFFKNGGTLNVISAGTTIPPTLDGIMTALGI